MKTEIDQARRAYRKRTYYSPAQLADAWKAGHRKNGGAIVSTKTTTAERYDVFVRDWWRDAEPHDGGGWPKGLVPYGGAPKTYIGRNLSFADARELCAEYRAENEPGRYSRKAEFETA